jgi:hypothetical protein
MRLFRDSSTFLGARFVSSSRRIPWGRQEEGVKKGGREGKIGEEGEGGGGGGGASERERERARARASERERHGIQPACYKRGDIATRACTQWPGLRARYPAGDEVGHEVLLEEQN